MRINKYLIPSFLSCLLVFSCTQDFEEINTNPNGPITVPAVLLIPSLAEGTMDILYSTFNGGDMGSCWAQHWAKVQYNDEERYKPRATQFDAIWNGLYAGTIQDANIMYTLAVSESNENLQGVALVMKAYAFSVLTDIFGDIPYSQALKAQEGINLPAYDTQEEVYTALLAMLDDANDLFSADGGTIDATSDIVYGGDHTKWQKFANALKFRLLMRMSNRADFSLEADLQEIVDDRAIFSSNDDEAKLVYLAAAPNNNPVNASIVGGNRAEYKVNKVLVDLLISTGDPRLEVYAQPNTDDEYRGKPSGIIDVPSDEWSYDNISPIGEPYIAAEAPAYFVSYAEQELLIAEAAKRGLITGGDAVAEIHYDNGVLASMDANGIDAATAASYLTGNGYSAVNGETLIQMEKWVALYGQGIEAWTEWRRTQIPALTPALEGAIAEIPSRYQYPPTEQALNGTNYDAAVAVQGADLLTTKVWWMK
jgi:hypothetical protein